METRDIYRTESWEIRLEIIRYLRLQHGDRHANASVGEHVILIRVYLTVNFTRWTDLLY